MELNSPTPHRSLDGVKRRSRLPVQRPAKPSPPVSAPIITPLPPPTPPQPTVITPAPPLNRRQRLRAKLAKLIPRTRKQKLLYSGAAVMLVVTVLGLRVLIASCKVLACNDGNGALALQQNVDPTKLRGEGDGRVNILLIGIGGANHVAGDLSDSIMIASLDPISKDVTLFSLPRDLYLKIPGYGSDRINAAHVYGERDHYEGGGPALLKETVSEALGVPIHYYVRADFDGFKEAVEAVGGVEVDVEQAIYDYLYPRETTGGLETFQLAAGRQFMNAETALKYVRSRETTSDFDRSKRQQKLMIAIKQKALSIGTLTNPVKINSLISAIGNHVKSDFDIDEIVKLVKIGEQVRDEQITRANLDNSPENYLASSNVRGASVLVPKAGDFSQIRAYVRSLFVDGYIKNEAASIELLNGTTKPALALATSELLRSYGYRIDKIGDAAEQDHAKPVIYDYSGGSKPYTLRYLEQRFGVKAERKEPVQGQAANITVILGSDYVPQS